MEECLRRVIRGLKGVEEEFRRVEIAPGANRAYDVAELDENQFKNRYYDAPPVWLSCTTP